MRMRIEPNTVLDGGPHHGLTVDVSGHLVATVVDDHRYVDSGCLHWHEQHCWLRWFRWQDVPQLVSLGR